MDLGKLDLVDDILVSVPLLPSGCVLGHLLDLDFAVLRDNFLHVELEEAIEATDLLRYETVLLEVSLDHGPSIV